MHNKIKTSLSILDFFRPSLLSLSPISLLFACCVACCSLVVVRWLLLFACWSFVDRLLIVCCLFLFICLLVLVYLFACYLFIYLFVCLLLLFLFFYFFIVVVVFYVTVVVCSLETAFDQSIVIMHDSICILYLVFLINVTSPSRYNIEYIIEIIESVKGQPAASCCGCVWTV